MSMLRPDFNSTVYLSGPDGDFPHPALDPRLIKLRQACGLSAYKILELCNAADLLIP